jgi:hypothetical protein
MSEQHTDGQDPRVELVQAVYDRVNSWQETATTETIEAELDDALGQAGVELDPGVRERLVSHIESRGGREDVARLL